MNHLKPDYLCPEPMRSELLRLARLDKQFLRVVDHTDGSYSTHYKHQTWLSRLMKTPGDQLGVMAMARWLVEGPKVFRPTKQQQDALAQVDVNLWLPDYHQPYPAILIDVQSETFDSALVYRDDLFLLVSMHAKNAVDSIITTIYNPKEPIENILRKYDEDAAFLASECHRVARIAINSCLALAHYGSHMSLLFPHEAQNDYWLARHAKKQETREGAHKRTEVTPTLLSFAQTVKLHETHYHDHDGEPTGREVKTHWRRGHWRRQNYGKDLMQTKTIFIKPVMVRADLFTGDLSNTTTTYKG